MFAAYSLGAMDVNAFILRAPSDYTDAWDMLGSLQSLLSSTREA
jgi:uncharacterized protein YutE (UPF0331/DUF86 family)